MPANRKNKINLLPSEGFDISTFGRVLKWTLSTFRILVILTELIVMAAFLSRFWLDAKNSDLNNEIDTNKAQVLAYSDTESSMRQNQKKINIAKIFYTQKNISEIIENFSKLIPSDISLNSISISENLLTIRASSFSEQSIMQFLINLDSDDDLSDTNLSQVSSSVDNSYITVFTISAKLKGYSESKGSK